METLAQVTLFRHVKFTVGDDLSPYLSETGAGLFPSGLFRNHVPNIEGLFLESSPRTNGDSGRSGAVPGTFWDGLLAVELKKNENIYRVYRLAKRSNPNIRSIKVMEKIGMTHDPSDDFENPHPQLKNNWLYPHVLCRISNKNQRS
jgi:hypothetical protein